VTSVVDEAVVCGRSSICSARHCREPGEEQVSDPGLKVFRDEQIGRGRGRCLQTAREGAWTARR